MNVLQHLMCVDWFKWIIVINTIGLFLLVLCAFKVVMFGW